MRKAIAVPTHDGRAACGTQILATVSQHLAAGFGAGLNLGQAIVVTLSRQLIWSQVQAPLPVKAAHVLAPSR